MKKNLYLLGILIFAIKLNAMKFTKHDASPESDYKQFESLKPGGSKGTINFINNSFVQEEGYLLDENHIA